MNTTNERYKLNKELAQMLKGGVIMDVTTPEQAKIAEAAGACAVMALERIPADIRAAGGVSRMSDPKMIQGIQNAVSIPVMVPSLPDLLYVNRQRSFFRFSDMPRRRSLFSCFLLFLYRDLLR